MFAVLPRKAWLTGARIYHLVMGDLIPLYVPLTVGFVSLRFTD